MAPTEVLARQHALTVEKLFARSQVRRASLTGGMATKQRTALLEQIAAGEIDLVVGTQAVIQEDVRFARLGLVVIDEQHKFGVLQRAVLKQAGPDPHYLVMTATPIPRTVAMTLFGDLDVSILREGPPGRQTVHTYWATEDRRARWWEFFRQKLREGRQGLRRHAAGRGFRPIRRRQSRRDLRVAGQRRVGGLPPGLDPRPNDRRGEGRRDGPVPQRRNPGARGHVGRGSGRRRAQRHVDDDRERRIASAWPNCTSCAGGSAGGGFPASAASSPIPRPPRRRSD